MTSQHDHPSGPWAGDPRLVEAVEAFSLDQLDGALRVLSGLVEQSRAFDGGELWSDPPVQAALGAVYDEITRRIDDTQNLSTAVEFFNSRAMDAYSTCLVGLLDGRSPAERTADLTRCSYPERLALVQVWARLEMPHANHGLDSPSDPVEQVSRAVSVGCRAAAPTEPGSQTAQVIDLRSGVAPGPSAPRGGHDRGGPRPR